MDASTQQRLGIAGLLAFEVILTGFLVANGILVFAAVSGIAALVLAAALLMPSANGGIPAWMLWALAGATLLRAVLQALDGFQVLLVVSFLVPVGFAVAALAPEEPRRTAQGIGLVGVCRGVFCLSFVFGGNPVVGVANLLGAVGGLLWAKAASEAGAPQAKPSAAGESA